ncbi:MAG: hypothetical protein NKF70_00265 [Methanobacterium sp. ERen5]|nr:MAG: hypothetical protein NKF70_00265 [Methanobacterium sp. ERen5]
MGVAEELYQALRDYENNCLPVQGVYVKMKAFEKFYNGKILPKLKEHKEDFILDILDNE